MTNFPFIGFVEHTIFYIRMINLLMGLGGEGWKIIELNVLFIVVTPYSNNPMLGRTNFKPNKIITSIAHKKLPFPTLNRVRKTLSDQGATRKCYANYLQ